VWLVVYNNNVCVVTEAVSEDMYSVYNSYSVFLLKNRHFSAVQINAIPIVCTC